MDAVAGVALHNRKGPDVRAAPPGMRRWGAGVGVGQRPWRTRGEEFLHTKLSLQRGSRGAMFPAIHREESDVQR